MESLLINIQKCSIHDGPGIRTSVFFKGCPLECHWCHNPESQSYSIDFMYDEERCSLCGRCIDKCHNKAIYVAGGTLERDGSRCDFCGECLDVCLNNARELVGESVDRKKLVSEITKDMMFYDESGGGVTLSGGEVMCQDIDMLENIIDDCNSKGIDVAIDTCGYAPKENFERIYKKVKLFLYDIKLIDPDKHKYFTGKTNDRILENLEYLSSVGANINIRIPLIGGVNVDDNNEEILKIIDFIKDINVAQVNLLPYHSIMVHKYEKLGIDYKGQRFYKPSDKKMDEILKIFEKNKFNVKIGG